MPARASLCRCRGWGAGASARDSTTHMTFSRPCGGFFLVRSAVHPWCFVSERDRFKFPPEQMSVVLLARSYNSSVRATVHVKQWRRLGFYCERNKFSCSVNSDACTDSSHLMMLWLRTCGCSGPLVHHRDPTTVVARNEKESSSECGQVNELEELRICMWGLLRST